MALVRARALALAMGTIGNFLGDHHATDWLWFGLELWLWLWERSVAFGAIIMPLGSGSKHWFYCVLEAVNHETTSFALLLRHGIKKVVIFITFLRGLPTKD